MARWQPRCEHREQIDPFNAPDPVMPGDDVVVRELPARRARRAPARASATPARPEPAEAPAARPPEGRRAGGRPRSRPGRAGGVGRGVVRVFLAIVIVIVVINVVGSLASALLGDGPAQGDVTYDYYEDDRDYEAEARVEGVISAEAAGRVEARLEAYVGADEDVVAQVGESYEQAVEDWSGIGAEALGIDATELARWSLENSAYEMSDTYAFATPGDGGYDVTGSVFFYLTRPDPNVILEGVSSLCRGELWDAVDRGSLTPDERALVSDRLEGLRADALAEPQELFLYLDYTGFVDEGGEVTWITLESGLLDDLLP